MDIIVQKFGGTSISSKEGREKACNKIIQKYNLGYKIVVVVSAMGRKGDPYATDTLLNMIDQKMVTDRDIDMLISCGEIISSIVLANDLYGKGLKVKVLSGKQAGILTDNNFGDAEIIDIDSTNVIKYLNENNIVIVPGFQGSNENGEITTLGRGGSDISAVAMGKAVNSNHVEIFTNVDGIMTADPHIVSDARVLKEMCYSEVYQLAENGAKVIHPRAIAMAERFNISLMIKNTYSENEGTFIKGEDTNFIANRKELSNENIINAITYKKGRTQVKILLDNDEYKIDRLMDQITLNHISLDLINFLIDQKIFTIDKNDIGKLTTILDKENLNYKIIEDCCKISAIGYRMQGVPGVMARIIRTLSNENIEVLQTSDSHNTIWCLIKEKDTEEALASLHKEFKLNILKQKN